VDEKLARSVADELVTVTVAGGVWVVSFRAEVHFYRLTYDREEVANGLAEALRLLAIAAIRRYNGASPTPDITRVSESIDSRQRVSKREPPLMPIGGILPDLFAGELEAMSKILARVSGLLGKEARHLLDLGQAAAHLATEAEEVAYDMSPCSSRDSLLLKASAVSKALTVLSKE
jgi:hypothetical protein